MMKNTTSPNTENKLREVNAQLLERIEQLEKLLAASEQARTLAESRTAYLSARIAAHEESLQLIGGNWLTPSDVTSVTYDATVGVCVNGIPIRVMYDTPQDDQTAQLMKRLAEEINLAKRLE